MTRHWRTFAPSRINGSKLCYTMFGPVDRVRPGMLAFVEGEHAGEDPLPEKIPMLPGVILCTPDLSRAVGAWGHEAVEVDDPRDVFWRLFRDVAERHLSHSDTPTNALGAQTVADSAYVAPTARLGSVALKVHDGRIVPNLGGVVIHEHASVGEFTAVDAGIYGEDTEIHEGAHVDNLVHVGHSVIVGAGAVVVAGSVLGGWSEIGPDAWVGIGACIRDGVKVGAGALVGMGAVVTKDVSDRAVVVGNPARFLRWREQ